MAVATGTKRKVVTASSAGGHAHAHPRGSKSKFPKSGSKFSSSSSNNTKSVPKVDPNLSSSKQKRVLKHERQSHRRHADVVKESKEIWNSLRLKTNTKEQIANDMTQLMTLLFTTPTTVSEIALQHDASRVVQAAVQFATPQQRRQLIAALSPQLADMAKVQYAHFCVLKMIQYSHRDQDCTKLVIKAFKGHICKLAVHAVGARVVELLFATYPPKLTNGLKMEFYGPHFSLFTDTMNMTTTATSTTATTTATTTTTITPTLSTNIAAQPDKKEAVIDYLLHNILTKGMDKGLYGFAYFQQLLYEYCVVADKADLRSASSTGGILSTLSDQALHLLSTRSGTLCVVICAAYGTPKDRKRLVKALKGYTKSSLFHRDAYLAILQIILVMDDTVSVSKSILAELLVKEVKKTTMKRNGTDMEVDEVDESSSPSHALLDVALHDQASKLLLLILSSAEDDNDEQRQQQQQFKYLDPLEHEVLYFNPTIKEGGEEMVPTSKKNASTRRKELLAYLLPHLIALCCQHTSELATSLPGSRVLELTFAATITSTTTATTTDGSSKTSSSTCAPELLDAIVALNVWDDKIGHYLLKHLVTNHDCVCHALVPPPTITSSRMAFVVAAMICHNDSNNNDDDDTNQKKKTNSKKNKKKMNDKATMLMKTINKNQIKQALQAAQTKKEATAGFEALLKALE